MSILPFVTSDSFNFFLMPESKFSNAVKGASIVGKGRAGPFGSNSNGDMTLNPTREKPEKVGIQMSF